MSDFKQLTTKIKFTISMNFVALKKKKSQILHNRHFAYFLSPIY